MNLTVLQDLRAALAELDGYGDRLNPHDVTPEALRALDESLILARRLVAAAANRPVTGCRLHPTGPVDSEAGECLLCNTRRRRATTHTTTNAPVEDVLHAVDAHGHDAAVRTYGARPVARALATAGRGTTTNRTRGSQ
ncbi:hypothetical protein SJI45_18825 [Streptomyces sp. S399]|uniref:hypothetical protein n=1 Tax=Streptomyces sp. S399 TaxID=3096009 RepID=UPI002A8035DD|nr:hypothetical protein [Streptomyces sp. S399]WPR52792.1 hypothetical protein SJI45_18825 [Streptomyces sp. S399]